MRCDPEEPRRGPDGSVYVHTLACGMERITDIATSNPKSQLIHVFPGTFCGVPTIVGMPHWTGWDPRTQRLVVTGYSRDHRLFHGL